MPAKPAKPARSSSRAGAKPGTAARPPTSRPQGVPLGERFVLVPVEGRQPARAMRLEDSASELVAKAVRALRKPGIDRAVVFRDATRRGIYAYSVDPADPSRVIREAADGTSTIGRLIDGRFKPVKSA